MIKASAITNRLSITMAGLIIDYLFSSDQQALADIKQFKCGVQRCCIQTKMCMKVIFLYNLYIFVRIQHNCLANMVFAL